MWLRVLRGSIPHTIRRLVRDRVFAGVALLSLVCSLCAIAMTSALVKAIAMRSSGVFAPEQVAVVTFQMPSGATTDTVRADQAASLRNRVGVAHFATELVARGITGDFVPVVALSSTGERLEATAVSADYFRTLGISIDGRWFRSDEDLPGGWA